MFSALFSTLLAGSLATAAAAEPPTGRTDADRLEAAGLDHHEVLRIQRDFGQRSFLVVIDAWSPEASHDQLKEIRMWWLNERKEDERSPFGRGVRKHVDIVYTQTAPDAWVVELRGDDKRMAFSVELDGKGKPSAFGTIITPAGQRVEHCRAVTSTLVARRFLGIPIGLDHLAVTCVDEDGDLHRGALQHGVAPGDSAPPLASRRGR
jgi:hypothetical protein